MSHYIRIENNLKKICSECDYLDTDRCVKNKCNVGFAENVIKYAKENSLKVIEDGHMLVPKEDTKLYCEDEIATAVAEVCKLCKQCRENHNEQCIISLCRHSLENTVLKGNITYHGSVLMYLMDVAKQNSAFAEKIKYAYDSE